MKKFIQHIEDKVKPLFATFLQKPMTDLTNALKGRHEAAEKCHICLKDFDNPDIRIGKASLQLHGFIYRRSPLRL